MLKIIKAIFLTSLIMLGYIYQPLGVEAQQCKIGCHAPRPAPAPAPTPAPTPVPEPEEPPTCPQPEDEEPGECPTDEPAQLRRR